MANCKIDLGGGSCRSCTLRVFFLGFLASDLAQFQGSELK